MTSGTFASIAIDQISVFDRARVEFKPEAEEALAESISRLGLIQPIVVTRELVLVAGERRLRACRSLGWTSIPAQYTDELSDYDLRCIELEENIKRSDFSWQEQVTALARLHELKKANDPNWSHDDTAKSIGLARNTVSRQLAVAKELIAGNERIVGAKEYSVALGIVTRSNERKAADEKSLIADVVEAEAEASPILNVDFTQWVQDYSGLPFNLIHCDFPYGINADKFNQGAGEALGDYDDTPETYWRLVETLVRNKEKLLGESGHVLFWFSMRHYTATLASLSAHFRVDPYPLVWFKSDNTGTLPDPQRGPRRVYEVAFLASHGDRKIIQPVANTFAAPVTRLANHMSEKSQTMLQHFFRMFVDENTRLLDPTCGSGSALRAAKNLGAKSILGLELNTDFAEEARRALDKET